MSSFVIRRCNRGVIREKFDNPLVVVVPEVGIEPTRTQGPEDFESSASTSFTTPALNFDYN